MKNVITVLFTLLIFNKAISQHQIIPAPVIYEYNDDLFMLDNNTKLDVRSSDPQVKIFIQNFQEFLKPLCNMSMDEGRQIFGLLWDQIDMEQVQIEVCQTFSVIEHCEKICCNLRTFMLVFMTRIR
jgi:hypothetical protein